MISKYHKTFKINFFLGILTIPWTMTAELYPDNIRGLGHSISFAVGTALMFVAVQSYRQEISKS